MTQRPDAEASSRAIPTTGMRGGLGRTLLTAFLILTILPLAVIGGYAVRQNQRNLEQEARSRLSAIAEIKGEALLRWFEELQIAAASLAVLDGGQPGESYDIWWSALNRRVPDLAGAIVLGSDLTSLWEAGDCREAAGEIAASLPQVHDPLGSHQIVFRDPDDPAPAPGVAVLVAGPERTVVLCLETVAVDQVLQTDGGVGETITVGFVWASPQRSDGESSAIPAQGEFATLVPAVELYQHESGDWVIGAYHPLPELGGGVLVEQAQAEVMASTERMAAAVIALVLAVALGTTVISAVVVRHITRPVIDLTESAVAMAEGNLDQHLAVRSRDEIGILTYVFNDMASELRSLYDDLEAKVVERTKRLQQANYQIQRRALHLQASQEVSQTITSIRDPALLLLQVTDLIRSHFIYTSVAVYLVPPGGGEARLEACSPLGQDIEGDANARCGSWPAQVKIGDGSLVGRALRKGVATVHNEPAAGDHDWQSRMQSQALVPLKMADRVFGGVAVVTTTHEGIQQDELEVLEVLANQVTIALENARTYERERQAIEQLEETEAFKARFLANMSHELMEPLNAIIGFSRLLIKGIEGPLSQHQQEDLDQIYSASQHLLDLIQDILAISQIQAGMMELRLQPVDLGELVAGVMPTASALVRGKAVELHHHIAADLPWMRADPTRLRQVLVHLLSNAAKFTEKGEIRIRAWASEGEVFVGVSDTGIGIPVEDRERIFTGFEKGIGRGSVSDDGVGIGLALCKEFIELHGGQIWVDSDVGAGSIFTFSVPVYNFPDPEAAA